MKRSLCIGLLLAVGTPLVSAFAQSARLSSPDQPLLSPDQANKCPVTLRPEKAFVPPIPYLHRPPDPVSFWYGTPALWTQVWAPPPWTPWKAQQSAKMFWASADTSNDERPPLVVSIKRLGSNEPPKTYAAPDAISFTPKRFGMVAQIKFPSAGCWQVTGNYHENSLSYVVQIETADSVPASQSESPSQAQPGTSPAQIPSKEHILFSRRPPEPGRAVLSASVLGDIACGGKSQRPCTEKEQRRFDEADQSRKERFQEARKMLLKQGVPFDPDILLEVDWRTTLKPVFERMPEMKQILRVDFLSGVVIADTLYISGAVETGPVTTIVIVNHVVSEGCSLVFQGQGTGGAFHYFDLGPGRVLGMSLEKALKLNGLTMEQFGGKDHLPPFSVIRDLDLPKPHCRIPVNLNATGLSAIP